MHEITTASRPPIQVAAFEAAAPPPREAAQIASEQTQSDWAEAQDPDMAILLALAAMARISQRSQAEVQAALYRVGLFLPESEQEAALEHLFDAGSIQGVIPLNDGGMFVSVTSAGMQRASCQVGHPV